MNRQNQDRADKVAHVYKKQKSAYRGRSTKTGADRLHAGRSKPGAEKDGTRRTACIFKAVY